VRDLYAALWGTRVPTRIVEPEEAPSVGFGGFGPVTTVEIRRRLARTKGSTAPGPDNIKKAALMGVYKSEMLAELFNLILLSGILPLCRGAEIEQP